MNTKNEKLLKGLVYTFVVVPVKAPLALTLCAGCTMIGFTIGVTSSIIDKFKK